MRPRRQRGSLEDPSAPGEAQTLEKAGTKLCVICVICVIWLCSETRATRLESLVCSAIAHPARRVPRHILHVLFHPSPTSPDVVGSGCCVQRDGHRVLGIQILNRWQARQWVTAHEHHRRSVFVRQNTFHQAHPAQGLEAYIYVSYMLASVPRRRLPNSLLFPGSSNILFRLTVCGHETLLPLGTWQIASPNSAQRPPRHLS